MYDVSYLEDMLLEEGYDYEDYVDDLYDDIYYKLGDIVKLG